MGRRVWTFEREGQRLSLARDTADTPILTVLTDAGRPRQYRFDDLSKLIRFQANMETFLLRTGWAFERFSPESRRGSDRRGFPRTRDRRRWWTDGSKSKAVWGG